MPAADRAEHFRQLLARLCEALEFKRLDFEGGQRTLLRHLNPGGLLDFIRDTVDRLMRISAIVTSHFGGW